MTILAVILILVGLVWTFQGLGILGGSFMTGERQWLYIGVVVAIAGVALLARTLRRRSVD